ncbi:MAG: NrfD/PsrC family molybdoenzyme membrane anchor subunit [Syntrophobacteraceae bacterium]
MEITITGANELTYPTLHIWNWMVSLYLFLGGITAGLLMMSSIANLKGNDADPQATLDSRKAAMIAPFVLMAGMFFIWLDLERKLNSFWFFFSFSISSPMSWGGWGLGLILPISMLYALSVVPEENRHWLRFGFLRDLSRKLSPHMRTLAKICFALGIFLGIYTGVLLSVFVARPLWNSSLLPLLFLTSALSTGAALIIIIARKKEAQIFFTKADIWLLSAEIIIIALFFLGHLTSTGPQRESVMPFFSYNSEYFLFGLSFVFIAVVFPLALVLKLLELKEEHHEQLSGAALFRMKLSAYMVLAGGFMIRLAWVYAGQLSKLT